MSELLEELRANEQRRDAHEGRIHRVAYVRPEMYDLDLWTFDELLKGARSLYVPFLSHKALLGVKEKS